MSRLQTGHNGTPNSPVLCPADPRHPRLGLVSGLPPIHPPGPRTCSLAVWVCSVVLCSCRKALCFCSVRIWLLKATLWASRCCSWSLSSCFSACRAAF